MVYSPCLDGPTTAEDDKSVRSASSPHWCWIHPDLSHDIPGTTRPGNLTKSYWSHGHRNSGFSHETWWIFPSQNVSLPWSIPKIPRPSPFFHGESHGFWSGVRLKTPGFQTPSRTSKVHPPGRGFGPKSWTWAILIPDESISMYDPWISSHRIGLWENLQESPINLMVKTMVSCKFSLKPLQWSSNSQRKFQVEHSPSPKTRPM